MLGWCTASEDGAWLILTEYNSRSLSWRPYFDAPHCRIVAGRQHNSPTLITRSRLYCASELQCPPGSVMLNYAGEYCEYCNAGDA